jgi:hypothetical protein
VPKPPADPLLTVRAAVVLLLSLLAGVSAAVLTYPAYHSAPGAVLAGGSAAGGAVLLFNTVIGRLGRHVPQGFPDASRLYAGWVSEPRRLAGCCGCGERCGLG